MSISSESLNSLFGPNEYGDFANFEYDEGLGMFVGEVVHHEFTGVEISERQKRVWELIRRSFGEEAQMVSIVLAFSPVEWAEIKDDAA